MTSKKPQPKPKLPTSKTAKAEGSTPDRPATSTDIPPSASQPAQSTASQLVRLHDLNGVAVFYLPAQLLEILGAELLAEPLDDVRRTKMTLIVRTPGDVIYVDLPILIKTLSAEFAAVVDAAKASGPDAARDSDQGDRDD